MATLIIRSLDDGLAARLKKEAQQRGLSVNKYLHQLLAQSLSAVPTEGANALAPRNDLRRLAGRWTARQARDFNKAVAPFSDIDLEMWK